MAGSFVLDGLFEDSSTERALAGYWDFLRKSILFIGFSLAISEDDLNYCDEFSCLKKGSIGFRHVFDCFDLIASFFEN